MHYDCLIVDDEEALSQSTCEYFNMFEVKTAWADSTEACREFLSQNDAALILLDINLGQSSGFELCKELRESTDIPILFISARTSDDDMILALNIGGDDYIQKPYSLAVLLAKVKAVLKRHDKSTDTRVLCFGKLLIDLSKQRVTLAGAEVQLKAMEYKLLCYLALNNGQAKSKEDIFQNVWEDAITGDNTLNVHVRRLREKIEDNPNEPQYIKTVWGKGYVFDYQ